MFSGGSRVIDYICNRQMGVRPMDLCRTLIVAMLAVMMIQMSERLSYDAAHGLRLAAVATAPGRA